MLYNFWSPDRSLFYLPVMLATLYSLYSFEFIWNVSVTFSLNYLLYPIIKLYNVLIIILLNKINQIRFIVLTIGTDLKLLRSFLPGYTEFFYVYGKIWDILVNIFRGEIHLAMHTSSHWHKNTIFNVNCGTLWFTPVFGSKGIWWWPNLGHLHKGIISLLQL